MSSNNPASGQDTRDRLPFPTLLRQIIPTLFRVFLNPNLFYRRRRPKLRGIPRQWVRPATDQKYYELLENEGFISPAGNISDEMRSDLVALDEYLLPDFFALDQEAKYYQNLYYLYQWVFILGALLTTCFAALGVALSGEEGSAAPGTILSILTAILSGLAATVSVLSASQAPHKQWFDQRTKAENLRSLYFLFLARQAPFNKKDPAQRTRQLQDRVLTILSGESQPKNAKLGGDS